MTSKTKTSFYRRLFVAYLVDTGVDTVPSIVQATGMPRRTAQDTIQALGEIDIHCEFQGANKNGAYVITNWGPISRRWLKNNTKRIASVLRYPEP